MGTFKFAYVFLYWYFINMGVKMNLRNLKEDDSIILLDGVKCLIVINSYRYNNPWANGKYSAFIIGIEHLPDTINHFEKFSGENNLKNLKGTIINLWK